MTSMSDDLDKRRATTSLGVAKRAKSGVMTGGVAKRGLAGYEKKKATGGLFFGFLMFLVYFCFFFCWSSLLTC